MSDGENIWMNSPVTGSVIGGSHNVVSYGGQAAPTQAGDGRRPSRSHRVGFVVDVVSYGMRAAPAQELVQTRLGALLRAVLTDVGADYDSTDHDGGSGDGMVVFLPSGEDPTTLLPGLLRATAERLAADNETYRDRVRLRMAVGSGLVGEGDNGFTGPLVVNISRLVDSEPLRAAVRDNPDSDLVVLVLDALHREVVVPGYLAPRVAPFELVDIALKEFTEPAWLWVGAPAQGL